MNTPCDTLCATIGAILDIIARDQREASEEKAEYFFRGETCNHKYPGNPVLDTAFDSLLDRNEGYWKNERKLYEEAMRLNIASFSKDRTMAERLARMQHYGLPTRFADLSENALLSVCFAAGGGNAEDARQYAGDDGFVRVIKVSEDKMKSFTSDIIIAISHLPLVACENINPTVKNGLGYLTYEIKQERPSFYDEGEDPELGKTLRDDLQQVWAFKPIVNNQRLRNQGGVFLAFGCRDGKAPLKPTFSPADYRRGDAPSRGIAQVGFVRIAAGRKQRILEQLRWFGMTEERIYPDLGEVCKVLKKRFEEK